MVSVKSMVKYLILNNDNKIILKINMERWSKATLISS